MKVVYMCHPEFENAGLRERPLNKNGGRGLSERPSLKSEGDSGTKNNKDRYNF